MARRCLEAGQCVCRARAGEDIPTDALVNSMRAALKALAGFRGQQKIHSVPLASLVDKGCVVVRLHRPGCRDMWRHISSTLWAPVLRPVFLALEVASHQGAGVTAQTEAGLTAGTQAGLTATTGARQP